MSVLREACGEENPGAGQLPSPVVGVVLAYGEKEVN